VLLKYKNEGRREPHRRQVAETLAQITPQGAVIISGIDPVFLEPYLLRGSKRRIIPVSRRVEYASKIVAYDDVSEFVQPNTDWSVMGKELLSKGRVNWAVKSVAIENLDQIARMLEKGVPVFLDLSSISISEKEQLLARFSVVEPAAGVLQLGRPLGSVIQLDNTY